MPQMQLPSVQIDLKTRAVLLVQPNAFLVGQEQKVLIPIFVLKQVVAQIMVQESTAEANTGDPRALPPEAPPNGRIQ